jgi:Protein of unknown function (DUF1579)
MTEGSDRLFDVPPPDPELRRLEPLVGSWRAEDHTQESVYGPGVPVRNIETFRWLEGGYFLVQEYETVFGDEPAQKGINYWYYDSEAERFRIIFFSNNGPFTEDGIGIRERSRRGSSRSSDPRDSSTSSTTKGRSRRMLTARSRSPGGYGTSGASGSPG